MAGNGELRPVRGEGVTKQAAAEEVTGKHAQTQPPRAPEAVSLWQRVRGFFGFTAEPPESAPVASPAQENLPEAPSQPERKPAPVPPRDPATTTERLARIVDEMKATDPPEPERPRDRMTGRQTAPPALASVPAPMQETALGQGQRRSLIPTPERPPEPTNAPISAEAAQSTPERQSAARQATTTPADAQRAENQPRVETREERAKRAREILAKARRENAAELVAEEKREMEQQAKAEKARADSRPEQKPDAQNRRETPEERSRRFREMMEAARRENARDRERERDRDRGGRGRGGGGMER